MHIIFFLRLLKTGTTTFSDLFNRFYESSHGQENRFYPKLSLLRSALRK